MRFRDRTEPQLIDWWRQQGFKVPGYLTDEQLELLDNHAEFNANKYTPCVVCQGTGFYRYNGEEFVCGDDAYGHIIMRLVRWYWLHNIPLQYQKLVWSEWPQETDDHRDAKVVVDDYIAHFDKYRSDGIGLTFYSSGLGTGKTWGATAVLKALVKQGVDGWFVPFGEVKDYYEIQDFARREYLVNKVRATPLLVLDEVQRPWSEASKRFFAEKLEELIRPRTNANLPTIITTNLTMEELEDTYPRVFSLLGMKNIEVRLSGSDARINGSSWRRIEEAIVNEETLPVD